MLKRKTTQITVDDDVVDFLIRFRRIDQMLAEKDTSFGESEWNRCTSDVFEKKKYNKKRSVVIMCVSAGIEE